MKHFATILTLLFLFSCSASKRTASRSSESIDSAKVKKDISISVSKSDSSNTGKRITNTQTKSDSGYTKKTTIREYYSDEFDFGPGDSLRPLKNRDTLKTGEQRPRSAAGNSKPGRLLYRETQIEERGSVARIEDKKEISQAGSSLKKYDSSSGSKSDSAVYGKEASAQSKSDQQTTFLPWWFWIIVAAVGLLILYKVYKKWL